MEGGDLNRTEIKLFVVSLLFQELLDELEGTSKFKQKVKFHAKQLNSELDKLNSVSLDVEAVSLKISEAQNALDQTLSE